MAQRCFAALGNPSKTFYLSDMTKISEKYEETTGPGLNCPEVRARLSLLNGDLRYDAMQEEKHILKFVKVKFCFFFFLIFCKDLLK